MYVYMYMLPKSYIIYNITLWHDHPTVRASWGEPERAPRWRVVRTSVLYHHHHHYHNISICCTAYHIFLFCPKRMAIIYERWNIRCKKLNVTWSPIEAKSTCRLLLFSTLTGTMLKRLASNIATSESLFGKVCSWIAVTERIILIAAHNISEIMKII